MTISFQPIGPRLLVQPYEPDQLSAGGLHLPLRSERGPLRGIVMAVGTEVKHVKSGQVVMFHGGAGGEIRYEGKTYTLLNEDQIFGIIHSDKPVVVIEDKVSE